MSLPPPPPPPPLSSSNSSSICHSGQSLRTGGGGRGVLGGGGGEAPNTTFVSIKYKVMEQRLLVLPKIHSSSQCCLRVVLVLWCPRVVSRVWAWRGGREGPDSAREIHTQRSRLSPCLQFLPPSSSSPSSSASPIQHSFPPSATSVSLQTHLSPDVFLSLYIHFWLICRYFGVRP